MALRIKARKTKTQVYGEEKFDVHNTYYQLSDERYITRRLAVEMVRNNELNGYHLYERDGVEYLRDNPDKEECDNINAQPIIRWPCDLVFEQDTSGSLLLNEDGSAVVWTHFYGEVHLSHDYLTRFLQEGGAAKMGIPISAYMASTYNSNIHFQAFERGIMFTGDTGEIEVISGALFQNYLRASFRSDAYVPGPGNLAALAAERGLGLPCSQIHQTPHGYIRVMGNGAMFFRGSDTPSFYASDFYPMIDGKIVQNTDPDITKMYMAVQHDPCLAAHRMMVCVCALTFAWDEPCGDTARDLIGTGHEQYCTEFVREVYRRCGMDVRWLNLTTYAEGMRRRFKYNSEFLWRESITPLTAEPGDYLYMNDGGHSALTIATSLDGQYMWKVGGNEGDGDCICYRDIDYFVENNTGDLVLNSTISGIGRLWASMFD